MPEPSPERASEYRSPWRIGWRGWKQVILAVKREIEQDNLSLISAGAAFFAFLAVFPAMAALISVYGLVYEPAQVQEQLHNFTALMPAGTVKLLEDELSQLTSTQSNALSFGALFGLLLAIWSANKGTKGMVGALNLAYDINDERGFIRLNLTTLGLTFGALLTVVFALLLAAGVPIMFSYVGLEDATRTAIDWLRWPLLAVVMTLAFAVLYHIGPARKAPRWRWVTPGSLLATVAFLAVSALFSLYVSRFGSYNETYGSVAAVAVFLLWLFFASFSVLLGAEVNAEIERQALGAVPGSEQQRSTSPVPPEPVPPGTKPSAEPLPSSP